MHDITVSKDIMEINRNLAIRNRQNFDDKKIFSVNIMGAVGSGKTSLIEALCSKLGDLRIGIIAGDVISEIDAERLEKTGRAVVGASTGKECHLDAHLVEHSLEKLPTEEIDLLLIENVGNLICPVDFDLGAHKNIVIVSVSEGDDTVEKHPMIFITADAAVINKIDIAEAVDADYKKMIDDAKKINPRLRIFPMSVKKDKGLDEFVKWLEDERRKS